MEVKHLILSYIVLCVLTGCGSSNEGSTPLNSEGEYRDDTAWAQQAYQGKPATQATVASQRAVS